MDGIGESVGEYIRIGGLLNGLSLPQLVHLANEQLPVEGVGVVEVNGLALFVGECGGVVLIRVKRHNGYIVWRQRLDDFLYYCCLAGSCSAGDSNDGDFIHDEMLRG